MRATVCVPSRTEERPLGRRLRAPLTRTGMGPRAARRAAKSLGGAAVAVTGVAGGVDPALRTGDVVVPERVLDAQGRLVRALPSATLVATRLRRAGFTVSTGPLVSVEHVATGAERARLRALGAVAVDMESAWLVATEAPAVVARVVADVADDRLLRPTTVRRLRTAVQALEGLAEPLDAWCAATADRQVWLPEPRSFCAGVERAIDVVDALLRRRGAPVFVRKEIVHNQHVVSDLRARGAVFVDDLAEVPPGATVVFSAHGVSPAVRADAADRGLDVVDATCPLVAKVHAEVRRFSDRGDSVLFIGHAGHEETEGTMGERPDRTVLVETVEDARAVQVADPARVSYLVQTTLAAPEVEGIVEVLRERFPRLEAPPSDDICYATTNRQRALAAVASRCELVLVVGSRNSSNSQRLVDTARRLGAEAHLVDDASDVDLAWLLRAEHVGVTAGASAPPALVDQVLDVLGGLGSLEVRSHRLVDEDVHFTLPKEVRPA